MSGDPGCSDSTTFDDGSIRYVLIDEDIEDKGGYYSYSDRSTAFDSLSLQADFQAIPRGCFC